MLGKLFFVWTFFFLSYFLSFSVLGRGEVDRLDLEVEWLIFFASLLNCGFGRHGVVFF